MLQPTAARLPRWLCWLGLERLVFADQPLGGLPGPIRPDGRLRAGFSNSSKITCRTARMQPPSQASQTACWLAVSWEWRFLPAGWEFLPGWRERPGVLGLVPAGGEFLPGWRERPRVLGASFPLGGNFFPAGGNGRGLGASFPLSGDFFPAGGNGRGFGGLVPAGGEFLPGWRERPGVWGPRSRWAGISSRLAGPRHCRIGQGGGRIGSWPAAF